MIRRFNYTKRRRIPKRNVVIRLICPQGQPMQFDAEIDLSDLDLAPEAEVWLEAYYKASYMRFPFGKVGRLVLPASRELTEIDRGTVVFFRVKVVDPSTEHGLVLAEADQIVAEDGGAPSRSRESILPVTYKDLGDEIWRLEFANFYPVLEVNQRIEGIREIVSQDGAFVSLVFPAVLRQVLQRIFVETAIEPDGDTEENWPAMWRRFVKEFHPEPPPAYAEAEEDRSEQQRTIDDWIDSAVHSFCTTRKVREQFVLSREKDQ